MTDIIFKVSRPTTVLITDLLEEDINAIEASKLPAVTVKLLNAYKGIG